MTGTQIAVRERVDTVMAVFEADRARQELAATLPRSVTVERFEQVVRTALLEDASKQRDTGRMLLAADPASLFLAAVKCATDGLMPDGREAALVKRGDSVTYQPMVGGFRKIAGENGWTIRGYVVCENDEFRHVQEPPSITHVPVKLGEAPGRFVAAYAVARHVDGRRELLVMDADAVQKRAKLAMTDKVWSQWPREMWEKTVVRALFAELPLEPAERERIVRVIEASELAPGDAAEQLYGPAAFGELPSGQQSPPADADGTTGDETGGTPAPSGQSSGAPPESDPGVPPGAGSGGSADDDFDTPPAGPTDDELAAAQNAAGFTVELTNTSSWAHNKTLAEIRADDRHEAFFQWALTNPKAGAALKQNATAYARVQLPALLEAA